MPRQRAHSLDQSRAGFTLIEMLIVVSVITVVFMATWEAFNQAGEDTQFNMSVGHVDAMTRKCVDRMTEDLADSGQEADGFDHVISHPKAVTTSAPVIVFQKRIDFTGDRDLDWGTSIQFLLQPSGTEIPANGVDDDNDSIVNEQQLVRVQDATTIVLADNVTAVMFSRIADEDLITVMVTLQQFTTHDTPPLARSLTSTIGLHNRN